MFYSNTFLARKGPLGTVWIAAHLQHKLNKKKVEETDIPTSCDYIMTSDVPIALRTSAHLLLGVVRIYSKKVDFLTHDCNEIYTRIRVMFASRHNVNLPADATCAPFNSITLPETFNLDALDLGDASYYEALDNHRSSPDDITLADQVPGEADAYVTFFFNEDIRLDLLPPEGISDPGINDDSGVRPMDEDVPTNLIDNGMEEFNQNSNQDNFLGDLPEIGIIPDVVNDFGPDNRIGHEHEVMPDATNDLGPDIHLGGLPEIEVTRDVVNDFGPDNHPGELPEIEVMRDAVNDFGSHNLEESLGLSNHSTEQLGSSSLMKETATLSPIMEDVPNTGGHSLPQLRADPPSVGALLDTAGTRNTSASPGFGLGNEALDLAIQPTPPVNNQIPRPRQRRHIFDTAVVFSNSYMRQMLQDTTGLVTKRKEMPHSNLDIWTFNKRLKVDQRFLDPCITGMCTQLQDVFTKEYVKVPTVPAEDTHADGNRTVPTTPTEENTHSEGSGTVLEEGTVPVEDANVEGTGTVPIEDSNVEGTGTVPIEDSNEGNGTVPMDDSNQEGRSVNTPVPVPENDLEIERLRDQEDQGYGTSYHDFMPSPFRGDEFTPLPSTHVGSEPPTGTTIMDTEPLPTLERTYTSTEPAYSDMETPMTRFEDQFGFENSGLSGIPELQTTAEEEDLRFLDGDNTPAELTDNESQALSVRTRAVAQYLKDQSPRTEVSKNPPGNLSLNKILEGKRRKTCARMFYETLVLKSHDLIDVRQEEAYGDITLLLGPLSNATF
ncbi:hypothetical protein ACHQM5_018852 [Ranunculus cassubicifolius]